jgi:4-amino-4-deoxy-L-arabinose transferase-like glycosyltransferase
MRRSLAFLRRHRALLAILTVALGLRCAYLPVDTSIVDQSGIQAEFAHNILEGHWFAENTQATIVREKLQQERHHIVDPAEIKYAAADAHPHWQPLLAELPGPGLMLAAVWEVTGSERLIFGKIVQIALDLGVLLLLYRIVLLLFARRRAALVAAALYAVCFPVARQTALVDPDIWALYFTIATIALYLQAMRSPHHRRRWLVACGLTVGIGALFRANIVLLPVALGLASIRWPSTGRALCWPGAARPLRGALAILAVSALVLAPWTIRNYIEVHRFIPIRTGSGMTLWEGLGEVHNNFGAIDNDLGTYAQVHRVHPNLVLFSPAYDEYLQHRALHAIAQHPLFYAKLVGRRVLLSTVALYESAWMYQTGESPVRYRARTGKGLLSYALNRPLELLESAYEPALFIMGLLALLFTWRRYRREHLLLIVVLLSAFLPYWLLHFEARYVLPALPIYLAWIGLGADLLGELLTRRLRARESLRGALA